MLVIERITSRLKRAVMHSLLHGQTVYWTDEDEVELEKQARQHRFELARELGLDVED